MDDSHLETVRSFSIVLFDSELKKCVAVSVPTSITAPFANRLLREVISGEANTIREPWYLLVPHSSNHAPLRRSIQPEGPTSLYGNRYDPETEPLPRVIIHPRANITHFTVQLLEFQRPIYQGDYSVDDIFRAGAEFLARRLIKQGKLQATASLYYEVFTSQKGVNTVSPDGLPANVYEVEGVFKLPPRSDDRERTVFHKLQPDPLPERSLMSYGDVLTLGRPGPTGGTIMLSASVYEALQRNLQLSTTVEDGGYLLGTPYRQTGSIEDEDDSGFRWLLEVTDVIQAEAVWGRIGSLLFTGETWSRITRRRDRDFPDKKLVAWFHTHLFSATDDFGLSGMDQDLHRRFLTKSWQVAVLLNIHKGQRTVRCFQRGLEGELVECLFHVFDPTVGVMYDKDQVPR
jgi:hypothetical protein